MKGFFPSGPRVRLYRRDSLGIGFCVRASGSFLNSPSILLGLPLRIQAGPLVGHLSGERDWLIGVGGVEKAGPKGAKRSTEMGTHCSCWSAVFWVCLGGHCTVWGQVPVESRARSVWWATHPVSEGPPKGPLQVAPGPLDKQAPGQYWMLGPSVFYKLWQVRPLL